MTFMTYQVKLVIAMINWFNFNKLKVAINGPVINIPLGSRQVGKKYN